MSSMAPVQRAMRRSCQFCRSRKIRCSGQDKCDACRERNIDCIYGRESSKGRPRRLKSKNGEPGTPGSVSNSSQGYALKGLQPTQVEVDMGDLAVTLLPPTPADHDAMGNLDDTAADAMTTSELLMETPNERRQQQQADGSSPPGGTGVEQQGSLATELELMFQQNFYPTAANKQSMNVYQEAISAFNQQAKWRSAGMTTRSSSPSDSGSESSSPAPPSPPVSADFKCAVMSYEAILSLLTQELVEMLSVKYGRLSCHHLGDTAATFYIKSLASDTTPKMITEPATAPPLRNPIQDFDLHRTLQMIEIWFSVHPLSTIVSKTLLLRQYRSNTHDEMLLSLIIADALYIGDGKVANSQGEAFFNYAISLLHTQPVRKCSLSTAQALTLLGWHELCLAKARRATCFLGYACRIVNKLMTRAAQVPTTGLSRINGIDAGEVEAELMRNIYWIILSSTLWSFMQFDQPFGDLLPSPLTMGFPPVEQSHSIVYKLDLVSGNISTFQRQGRMIRELWALSHITSTVGHVYSLFPRNSRSRVDLPSSLSWQARPLQQLRLLSNPRQDITILCARIREILAEATKQVNPQRVSSPASRATVLSAYHTLIVHLLFPRLDPSTTGLPEGSLFDEPPLTSDILDTFCDSARAFIDIARSFLGDDGLLGNDKVLYSTGSAAEPGIGMTTNMFVLGLDACARTLEVFCGRLRSSSSPSERAMLMSRKLEFSVLSKELHSITKIERLNIARRVRLVKKHFKMVRVQLDQSLAIDMDMQDITPPLSVSPSSMSGGSESNSSASADVLFMQRHFGLQYPNHHQYPAPPGYGSYSHQQFHHHNSHYQTPHSYSTASSSSSPEISHQHRPPSAHQHLRSHDQYMGSSSNSVGTPSSVGTPLPTDTLPIGLLTPQSTTISLQSQGMYYPGTPGGNNPIPTSGGTNGPSEHSEGFSTCLSNMATYGFPGGHTSGDFLEENSIIINGKGMSVTMPPPDATNPASDMGGMEFCNWASLDDFDGLSS